VAILRRNSRREGDLGSTSIRRSGRGISTQSSLVADELDVDESDEDESDDESESDPVVSLDAEEDEPDGDGGSSGS
jgi:hypothetical protein